MTNITIAPGLTFTGYDFDGLNSFLKTPSARGAGVIVTISGVLAPGKTDVRIISGQPIGEAAVKNVDGTLIRAAVLAMSPYFDLRHAQAITAGIMKAVANARQLGAIDERTIDALEYDDVPSGDILLVKTALVQIAREIDGVLEYPLIGIQAATSAESPHSKSDA